MLPIRPILSWPASVYEKLSVSPQEQEGLFKKIARLSYNTTLPILAATIMVVASVVGIILASIVNVLTFPGVMIARSIQKHSEPPINDSVQPTLPPMEGESEKQRTTQKTTQAAQDSLGQIPPTLPLDAPPSLTSLAPPLGENTMEQLTREKPSSTSKLSQLFKKKEVPTPTLKNFYGPLAEGSVPSAIPTLDFSGEENFNHQHVVDKNFPVILPRRTTHKHTTSPLNIASTWPPLHNKTNTLTLDFFKEKSTIPGTNVTFWVLSQLAGTEEGFAYLDENASKILPILCPSSDPSKLNKQAPALSGELLVALQNPQDNVSAKYLLGLTILLQYWGLTLSSQKCIEPSSDFAIRAAAIRNNSNREEIFKQTITSLGECGFGPLAAQLALLLDVHKKEYGLSGRMQEVLAPIYNKELSTQAPNRNDKRWCWQNYVDSFVTVRDTPVSLPPANGSARTTVSSAWTPNTDLSLEERLQKAQDTPWDIGKKPFLKHDQKIGSRWILQRLKAPQFFCSKQKEMELSKNPKS